MNYMNKFKLSAASAVIALFLTACGGGGGVSAANVTTDIPQNTATDTVISGTASKGPVTGTINFYVLKADGSKGSLLKSAAVDKGNFSAIIGKYAGPVLIEVIGSYTDEATGNTKFITADAPMRAALSNASGAVFIAVTSLTELAIQKAGALTASAIDASNKLVSDIFKIDIINTLPVAPTSAALNLPSVTQSQKDYTLVLAALSQLSSTRHDSLFSITLESVANGISYSGMDNQTVASLKSAVTDFIGNSNNKTGIISTDVSATNLAYINGGTTATFKLAITGPTNMAADAIKGIQFDIVIPNYLTVRSNAASGETLSGIVTASSAISSSQNNILARYSSSEGVLFFGLLTDGIGAGELATIIFDTLPGGTVPSASAFSVRNIKAVDGSAVPINEINVTVK